MRKFIFYFILFFFIFAVSAYAADLSVTNLKAKNISSSGTSTLGAVNATTIQIPLGDLATLLQNLPGTGTVTSVNSENGNITVSGSTGAVILTLAAVPFAIITGMPTSAVTLGLTDVQPLNTVLTQISSLSGNGCEGKVIKQIGGVKQCVVDETGSAPTFATVTSGTSSGQTFTVGNGGIIIPTGTGSITATIAPWAGLTGKPTLASGWLTDVVLNSLTVNSKALSGNIVLDKTDVGLGNVQNLDFTNPTNITEDATHRWATDAEKATWNGYVAPGVAGGMLSFSTPTITLLPSVAQKRVTGTASSGYAISAINEDGTVEVTATGGNPDFSTISSGIRSGTTDTVGSGAFIMAGGGQIQATEIVSSETPTYSATFNLLNLSADREITVPNRAFTLDNITTSTTSNIAADSLLGSNGTTVYGITLGANMTLVGGVLDSTGGAGTFAVTTSKITTDTTLSGANFGGSGLNPIKVTSSRLKLPTAAANLMRSISSKGTSTIWPASASDVITLNGTDLTAGNQVQCTGGAWIYGFGANDWSIDGSNCTDGGKPVLTASPDPLAFGSVSTSTTTTVGFSNTGNALATLGTPTLTGTDKARFTINNGCSSTLATSATCSIGVTFDATVGGPYSASLDFPYYNTTKSVAITGTGTAGGETIGYTTVGGSTSAMVFASTGPRCSGKSAPSQNGTITSIFVYSSNSSATLDMKVGVYTDSGGWPNTKVTGSPVTFADMGTWSAGWHEFTGLSFPVTSGTNYWLCLIGSEDSVFTIYYDTLADGATKGIYSYGEAWASPFVYDVHASTVYSIKATVTP